MKNKMSIGLVGLITIGLSFVAAPAQAAKPITVCASGCNYTTISDALNAAENGDTIRVAAGTYPEVLSITKSITLSGAGAGQTIIDASSVSGAPGIAVPRFAVITIIGVTITGSNSSGLDNLGGAVTFKNSIVSGNSIQGAGGGIRNFLVMTILNSTVMANDSLGGINVPQGGGIMNQGTLTLQNSIVTDNSADGTGGGIYNRSSSTLTVVNSTVTGNTAQQGGGIGNEGDLTIRGSAVSANNSGIAGGIFNFGGTLTLHTSMVSDNTAVASGGAIWNGLGGTATLQNSTITGNSVTTDDDEFGGGGIFNFGMLTVKGSTISNNHAPASWGGGILNRGGPTRIADSLITGNTALLGGGIYNTDPNLLVTNSSITGNSPDDCSGC